MKTPAHIKIAVITVLLAVVAARACPVHEQGPPPKQPWKSGATTVTLSGGTLRVKGAGAMWDHLGDYDYPPWNCVSDSITGLVIEGGVTHIGVRAFYGCNLTSVTIPGSVRSIGRDAFKYCSGLKSVTIPGSVKSIGENVFDGCTSLTSITIPRGVATIGKRAFWECTGLTSVTIPGSVAEIGEEAFAWCKSLTSIKVAADNARYSSEDGVLFNKSKTELIAYSPGKPGAYKIPGSVAKIGNYAFFGCAGLTSVTIPGSVTDIEYGAFEYTGLTSIVILNRKPPKASYGAFNDGITKSKVCLYVPAGSIAAYRADGEWGGFKCVIESAPGGE